MDKRCTYKISFVYCVKQKTAYVLRISDWSSDVCSSDLHNGLRDIHKVLGPDYLRLRIGIGHPGDKNLVLNYVLGRASKNDETAILDAFDDAGSAVETWLTRGWERALTQLHTRPVPPAGDRKDGGLGKSVAVRLDLGWRRLLKQ